MKLKTQTRLRPLFKSASLSLMAAAILGTASQSQAQTYTLSNIWALSNIVDNLDVSANNRGLASTIISNGFAVNDVIVNNKGTHALEVYDGNTGNVLNSNNYTSQSIITGGNFTLNKIKVDSTGVLYGANLNTALSSSQYYKVYQFPADWTQAPTVAYTTQGDANASLIYGGRFGDSLAHTGGGLTNQLLVNDKGSNVFLLLTMTNGTTFNSTVLIVPTGLPTPSGAVQVPLAFYTNNTFMIAPSSGSGGNLYLVQYPANYASLPSPVTATVIATNTSFPTAALYADIAYKPSAGLMAIHGNASRYIALYSLSTNSFSTLSLLATTNTVFLSNTTTNGNESGDIGFGGVGGTNSIFTLDTSAGVQGTSISFTAAPLAPSIVTAPTGGTVYTNVGSFTFSVSAGGTAPLYYQWQYSASSNGTVTNIPLATNSSYTISPITPANSGYYDVVVSNLAGITNSTPVLLTVITPLGNASVTQLWSLPADNSEPYLDTGYNTRGLAYDPITGSVLLAEHSGDNIYAINATNGTFKFPTTDANTGLPVGSLFNVGQVGVGDDGAVYICNVSSYQNNTTSDNFSVTRFDSVQAYTNADGSENEAFEAAFTGDPGNHLTSFASSQGWAYSTGDRWGDSMAVRGAGTNTQILLGTYESITSGGAYEFGTGPGTNVAILTTQDGTNFSATTLICFESDTPTNTPPDGFSYLGVAWGASNTFWTKSPGYNLRQFSFNLANGTATNIQDIGTVAGSGSLSQIDGIGLDVSNNILAGVNLGDTPNDVELFEIPTVGTLAQPYYQDFFAAYNANINGNAATAVKFPYIFSLDANNGIIGLKYSIPLLPVTIAYTNIGHSLILTYQTTIGHTFQLQSTASLVGAPQSNSWSNVGAAFAAPASGSQSYTNNSLTGSELFYRVVAH